MSLRIMAFNIQCKGKTAATFEGVTYENDKRSLEIAKMLALRFATPERPDIVFFEEAFDETARNNLISVLKAFYPYVTEPIGGLDLLDGKLNNSGLLALSRLPFLKLDKIDDKPTQYSEIYSDSAGIDAIAAKGFGIVQINTEVIKTVTIAWTHLQASPSDEEDLHRDVRVKQLSQIKDGLKKVLGDDTQAWNAAMIVGDTNIRGDGLAETDEWRTTFPRDNPFGFWAYDKTFLDGWANCISHRPDIIGASLSGGDEGYTNNDPDAGKQQRLDYMLFSFSERELNRKGFSHPMLFPHYMFVRERGLSDHYALEAVCNLRSANCTPITAFNIMLQPSVGDGDQTSEETYRQVIFDFVHDGTYQWVFVDRAGTFSWFYEAGFSLSDEVYLRSDLSNRFEGVQDYASTALPAETLDDIHYSPHPKPSTTGRKTASHEPFYILLKVKDGKRGKCAFTLVEHIGSTKETALDLSVNGAAARPAFPVNRSLGPDDTCWLTGKPHPLYVDKPRTETFAFKNPNAMAFKAELSDDGAVVASYQGKDADATLTYDTLGGRPFFLKIHRLDKSVSGLSVQWTSPANFLMLDKLISLYANEETGKAWPGSDEIEFTMTVDGKMLFSKPWKDGADSGEYWVGLREQLIQTLTDENEETRRLGFIDSIEIDLNEPDTDSHHTTKSILPETGNSVTTPKSANGTTHTLKFEMEDWIENGEYTFVCSTSRQP